MRTIRNLVVSLSLISLLFLFGITGISAAAAGDDDMISIQGIGYPPIRAESAAQARLMAKRAAVLDVYRNSLAASASAGKSEDVTYEELSGFVSGITVLDEEYLVDGGVRITARVPKKNIALSRARGPVERTEPRKSESSGGPQRISLDEWYTIIKKLVRIE
ncbi:MAG: hypothetical protein EPN25_04650 [Nitrospirae bacterium]|nr:MAG: hypothetical protein EPN25_04650 [Nitrospirota bacterium]